MKDMSRLILSQDLRYPLPIPQIAFGKLHARQFREGNGTLLLIRADHIPALAVQKPDHVRADKTFCSGYKCGSSQSPPTSIVRFLRGVTLRHYILRPSWSRASYDRVHHSHLV